MFITSGSDRATERGGHVMAARSRTRAATVRERALARRLGVPIGWLWSWVLSGRRRSCASEGSRAWGAERERSA
eukprot:5056924-Pleurochrysis_carterae.AAC.1